MKVINIALAGIFLLALVLVLATTPVHATENNSGFGDAFANTAHPAFEDPAGALMASDDAAAEAANIAPAAGDTADKEEASTDANVENIEGEEVPDNANIE